MFDSPTPEHYFHLQYQLLPSGYGAGGEEGGWGGVSKSDVVTFGVVSKVFTEKDARVVMCWEETQEVDGGGGGEGEVDGGGREGELGEGVSKKRSHFGWRHK